MFSDFDDPPPGILAGCPVFSLKSSNTADYWVTATVQEKIIILAIPWSTSTETSQNLSYVLAPQLVS